LAFQGMHLRLYNDAHTQSRGTIEILEGLAAAIRSSARAFGHREALLETLGPYIRDFSLYTFDSFCEAIRPLRGSPPGLFTSPTRRLQWINSTGVFIRGS
jgi:hypothetical protein